MRIFNERSDGPGAVSDRTHHRLGDLVRPYGWAVMMTEADCASPLPPYRAWLRHMSGRRMFGPHATTAEAAALALLAKVEPMTRGR